jgi:hypothetical protein
MTNVGGSIRRMDRDIREYCKKVNRSETRLVRRNTTYYKLKVPIQAKSRFDATAEELERVLVAKEGESFKEAGMRSSSSNSSTNNPSSASSNGSSSGGKRGIGKAMTKGGLLFKGKGSGSIQRQEDDVRSRMASASETYRKAVLESQALRQEYFNFQLPKILRVSLTGGIDLLC